MSIVTPIRTNVPTLSPKGWRDLRKAVRMAQSDPQGEGTIDPAEILSEDMMALSVESEIEDEGHDSITHVEKAPGSWWGGKEVSNGMEDSYLIKAVVKGRVRIPEKEEGDPASIILEDIKWGEYVNEVWLKDSLKEISSHGGEVDTEDPVVDVKQATPSGEENWFDVVIEVRMPIKSFKSSDVLRREYEDEKTENYMQDQDRI